MTPERALDENGVLRRRLGLESAGYHRSNRARSPSRRRVLHIDYAGVDLPAPLEWQVDTVSNQTTR